MDYRNIQNVLSRAQSVKRPDFRTNASWIKINTNWLAQHYELLRSVIEHQKQGTLDALHKALFERDVNRILGHISPIRRIGLRILETLDEFGFSDALKSEAAKPPPFESTSFDELRLSPDILGMISSDYNSYCREAAMALTDLGSSSLREILQRLLDMGLVYEALVSMEKLTLQDLPHSSPPSMTVLVALLGMGWGVYDIVHDVAVRDAISVLKGATQVCSSYSGVSSEVNPKLVELGRHLRRNRQKRLDQWFANRSRK